MWSDFFLFIVTYFVFLILIVLSNNLLKIKEIYIINLFFLFFFVFTIFLIFILIFTIYSQLFDYKFFNIYFVVDGSINGSTDIILDFIKYDSYESMCLNNQPFLLNIINFPFLYVFILITFISLLFCLNYNKLELMTFIIYLVLIFIFGFGFFLTDSLILFFLYYEMLLLPSFFILYKFAKTRKTIEASFLMFFWTQFGALFLIFSFLYIFIVTNSSSFYFLLMEAVFSKFEINFLVMFWIIGFGVKLPIWPFYGWLPKAHVEASTNFSIFLSGVLVKFAFFGLLKCVYLLKFELVTLWVLPYLTIGLLDSVFKLYYQIDIKKLIAYSTVVEMHWLLFCVLSGHSVLNLAGFAMFISHAILSSNSFLLVDSIVRRFKTRLVTEIHGLNFLCPKLFLVALINLIIFLGFPGSLFFIAEFLFFTFIIDFLPFIGFLFFILIYLLLPLFFLRSWMNVLFSYSNNFFKSIPLDLDKCETLIYTFLIFLIFFLGCTWSVTLTF
jgi:NADH-quinone oxidoreductase subunit M